MGANVVEKNPIQPLGQPAEIDVDNVTIVFDSKKGQVIAVDRASFQIRRGEFVCLLGPSGCGKSTILNGIAGFEIPYEGTIRLAGEIVSGPGPDRGMVFQQPFLFPWKSVRSNIMHGPRMRGKSAKEARGIADDLIEMIGLNRFADSLPSALSGGMQQRVAIARALANKPGLLLMDEPFGALDAQTRSVMQDNLLSVWSATKTTVVFVTHDIDEAIFLADRVIIMSAGPGRILADIDVDLPRPRSDDIVSMPRYVALKKEFLDHIRSESIKAFERQSNIPQK
jgi:NitT/TauT family transport system ATP-binding protein